MARRRLFVESDEDTAVVAMSLTDDVIETLQNDGRTPEASVNPGFVGRQFHGPILPNAEPHGSLWAAKPGAGIWEIMVLSGTVAMMLSESSFERSVNVLDVASGEQRAERNWLNEVTVRRSPFDGGDWVVPAYTWASTIDVVVQGIGALGGVLVVQSAASGASQAERGSSAETGGGVPSLDVEPEDDATRSNLLAAIEMISSRDLSGIAEGTRDAARAALQRQENRSEESIEEWADRIEAEIKEQIER